MEEIKAAASLMPIMQTLYKLGVIAVYPNGIDGPYVQITLRKFLQLWPTATPDEDGIYHANVDGMDVVAV